MKKNPRGHRLTQQAGLVLVLFAGATVLALAAGGRADGLATLLVIASAFTVRLLSAREDAAQLQEQLR